MPATGVVASAKPPAQIMPVVIATISAWRGPSASANRASGTAAHIAASSAAFSVARRIARRDARCQVSARLFHWRQARSACPIAQATAIPQASSRNRGPCDQNVPMTTMTLQAFANIVSGVSRSTACSCRARNVAATASSAR